MAGNQLDRSRQQWPHRALRVVLLLSRDDMKCIPNPRSIHARVLVADDNADLRELLAHQLGKLGTEVLMAANGQEAVDIALKMAPELVLMDLEMPVVSGLEAVAMLRQCGFDGVIVAFTAHDDGPRTQGAMANGCDAILKKPLSATKLRTRLVEYLGLRSHGRPLSTV